MRNTIASLLLLSLAAGCSVMKRSPEQYRTDTRDLLDTKSSKIRSCYDEFLAKTPDANGTVVVDFLVEKKTGTITDIQVNAEETKAPASLQTCVTKSIEGLVLTPVDRRDGDAKFSWTFKAPTEG